MNTGNFLAAQHEGVYIIKLTGDVRLTLCCVIDDFLQQMFETPDFLSVSVDLTEAKGIDSTSLGLLAKLALRCKQQAGVVPVLVCNNADINYLLKSMGFDRIYIITSDPLLADGAEFNPLQQHDCGESEVREKVIEAHKLLMGLSDENHQRFKDLVTMLEASR